MPAPQVIQEKIALFKRDMQRFKNPLYNEEQVRIEFINPLFRALGWDVENSLQVIHEDRVIVDDGGEQRVKHPDYGFSIGSDVRFYVEAKKPSVDLMSNAEPAYQVRRYGWSQKLPVCILTDFEELVIYNCLEQPKLDDMAHIARLDVFKFEDFDSRWDELYNLFSREAVERGALENYVSQKGIFALTVDEAFLRELESWREMLVKNIAIYNTGLNARQLNMAVQRTIDRIVFLRICEDRNIERYGKLKAQLRKNIYQELLGLYQQADDKYNSGLFYLSDAAEHPIADTVSKKIIVGDDPLRKIINNLYYPYSPYEFSVFPADILGQVYERFLGKVIELTENRAVEIVEKPEVRKAGGVYYTPTYIVDYIVANTVGKLLDGKTVDTLGKLRILDPACGSGSFLLGAYQYLMDWYLRQYSANAKKALKDGKIRDLTAALTKPLPPAPSPQADLSPDPSPLRFAGREGSNKLLFHG
jgi:predicted type IV restriction endonuclease